jgi:replication factor A1
MYGGPPPSAAASNPYGAPQQQQQQQAYNMGAGGPVARDEAPPRIIPIRDLTPYNGRWNIKARVTSKGTVRR